MSKLNKLKLYFFLSLSLSYLIAGTELGEAYLYQIKIDDEDKGREGEECTLELCQKIQSCLAPVTALHWLHNEQ